jgi:hypothetical protein
MMVRYSLAIYLVAVAATACSQKDPQRVSAALTAPSAVTDVASGGGVSRPAVVSFPARPDTLDFRSQLETKYASGLRRPVTQTIVDQEGESTWMGEYERYRVNGCDHDTAARNTLSQIDGVPAAQVCAVRYFPETAIYPSRDQVVDFRRQLGSKYQSMGRTAQSAVDPDGAAIWISEYLRYRTSGCDHATAVQKTMTQIDGNPAPPTCVTACAAGVGAIERRLVFRRTGANVGFMRMGGIERDAVDHVDPANHGRRSQQAELRGRIEYRYRPHRLCAHHLPRRRRLSRGQPGLVADPGVLSALRPGDVGGADHRMPAEVRQHDLHADGYHCCATGLTRHVRLARRVSEWRHEGEDAGRIAADLLLHGFMRRLSVGRHGDPAHGEADRERCFR